MAKQKPGWYPDPHDDDREIYWDGAGWHGRRKAKKPAAKEPERQSARPYDASFGPLSYLRNFWNGLSETRRKSVAAALAVVVCLIAVLFIVATQRDPVREDCEAAATYEGYRGEDFDVVVDFCVDNSR